MPYKLITSTDGDQLYNIINDQSESTNIAQENQAIVIELKNVLSQWQLGENRSLPILEVLKDPDLFGGEEDRIPWLDKAFKNAETNLIPNEGGSHKWTLLYGLVIIIFIYVWSYRKGN